MRVRVAPAAAVHVEDRHDKHDHPDGGRAALQLVAAGYAVVVLWWICPDGTCACSGACRPSDAGKHPLGLRRYAPHGYRSASRDPRIVERWWRTMPSANIGTATGDGYVVVDVDVRHGGDETLARLEAEYGPLPTDAIVDTPGGWHVRLATALPVRTRTLGPGLELLGTGKYAVAPPSVTYGIYRWRGGGPVAVADLPPAPAWLLALRSQRTERDRRRARPPTPLRLPRWLPHYLARSQRHPMLMRLAGWLRGSGYGGANILAVLTSVRDERCEQPGEIADRDLERMARYVGVRPAGTRRTDLRVALERGAATWTDRTAARDRRVLLDAIVPLIQQQGGGERVHLAVRSVAVLARIAQDTASRALRSLERRGVILAVRRARHGDDLATEYCVSSTDTSSGGGGEE